MTIFSSFAKFFPRITLALLVVPVIGLALPSTDPELPPMPEDLLPALHSILLSALRQSPQMIARNIDLASAEAIRVQDAASLYPSLIGSANYSSNKTAVAQESSVSSTSSGLFYNLTLNQPIYQFGALKAQADSGKIGVKIAEHQYADAYRLLVVNLRAQFLALVIKKAALRNAEFALKEAEQTLSLAEEKLKTGRISAEAMSIPRLAVDDARLTRDRAQEDLEYSKRTLVLTAGLNDLDLASVPETLPQPVYTPEMIAKLLQEFIASDTDDTYQTMIYHGYIKQADLDYRIARVRLLPKFSFSAGISQQNVTSASSNYVNQVGISSNNWNIIASWSIFDGFATRGAKLSALSRKRSYERALRTAAEQTIAQARDLAKQLDFAWRYVGLSITRQDISQTNFQRAQQNMKTGQASQTDVNDAQLAYYNAELTTTNARGGYLNNWSQFVSTLCVDPMLNAVPTSYLKDGK